MESSGAEPERRKRRRRRRRRRRVSPRITLRALLWLGAGLALALLLGLGWIVMVYPESRTPGRGQALAVAVDAGASVAVLGEQLQAAGLVERGWLWALYARVLGAGGNLRHGEVMLREGMSARQLVQRVARGFGSVALRITIPEGFDRFEIAERLQRWGICSDEAFLAATRHPGLLARLKIPAASAEGYLFPDTYVLEDGMDPGDVVARLVENADRRWLELNARAAADGPLALPEDWTRHQVVVLASIVEKEARAAEERPRIAGVFLNRLRDEQFRPHRLQADPTVAYGCRMHPELASCAGFDGRRVTRTMTADPQNTYNTYRLEGLPPGPIANPGLSAMGAVLRPEVHPFLYFVASGGGRHTFSETLEAHNAAVQLSRAR